MLNYDKIFKGKKITQMGLGLLGRGVGDADFLARHGADLTVTDIKSEAELKESVNKLKKYKNIKFHLGGHSVSDFSDRDLVLKGAGVPFASEYILEARKNNVPIDMSASLLVRITGMPIIGVTGTRGKSTVTHLLNDILKADGRGVVLGGNVKDVSNLSLLEDVKSESVGIFELDSWQCQGFGEEKSFDVPLKKTGPISPEVSVFTTFMPDHLNYYNGDVDMYLRDKANIFLYQDESNILVIGRQALPALEKYKKEIKANVVIADETDVPKKWKIKLIGGHNRYNIGVAIATARAFGVSDDVVREVVESARALHGRLEFVKSVNGIDVYNDTNATTPEATVVALKALNKDENKQVVLVAGGADKGLDTSVLLPAIKKYAKSAVFLAGAGTDKLFSENDMDFDIFNSLKDAVHKAFELADKEDVVLLSPGFASFGMFKNEFDRGERFVKLIDEL